MVTRLQVELVVRRQGAELASLSESERKLSPLSRQVRPAAVTRVRCDRAVETRRVSSSYEDIPFYISQQDKDSAIHEARARVQMIRKWTRTSAGGMTTRAGDKVYEAARQKTRERQTQQLLLFLPDGDLSQTRAGCFLIQQPGHPVHRRVRNLRLALGRSFRLSSVSWNATVTNQRLRVT
eukprot:80154-Hanusia_phi.AAC.2